MQLLLYWKGVPLSSGGREKVDLSAQDKVNLHILNITENEHVLAVLSLLSSALLSKKLCKQTLMSLECSGDDLSGIGIAGRSIRIFFLRRN